MYNNTSDKLEVNMLWPKETFCYKIVRWIDKVRVYIVSKYINFFYYCMNVPKTINLVSFDV